MKPRQLRMFMASRSAHFILNPVVGGEGGGDEELPENTLDEGTIVLMGIG